MIHWVLRVEELAITVSALDDPSNDLVQNGLADLRLVQASGPQGVELQLSGLEDGNWVLKDGELSLERRIARTGDVLYHLSDRIIFHLADKVQKKHCLHAAAVTIGESAIVIPAKSGAGKSSLTAWLVANHCPYITDELIMVDNAHFIQGIARPIQIKSNGLDAVRPLLVEGAPIQYGSLANAITAHTLGGRVAVNEPISIGLFLFPQYDKSAQFEFQRLSSAEAGMSLMSNHVNARNLPNHGFKTMMQLVRQTPCYSLRYGGFSCLPAHFVQQLEQMVAR